MNSPTPGYSYGQRLECIRDDHGLTIKAMAASVGVAPSTWRNYEKDETFPSPVTIGALCGIYHVNKEWLDTNEGEMYTDGYKPGDPLGKPISFKEMKLRELQQMPGLIGAKFSADYPEECRKETDEVIAANRMSCVEITVDHITGKCGRQVLLRRKIQGEAIS